MANNNETKARCFKVFLHLFSLSSLLIFTKYQGRVQPLFLLRPTDVFSYIKRKTASGCEKPASIFWDRDLKNIFLTTLIPTQRVAHAVIRTQGIFSAEGFKEIS